LKGKALVGHVMASRKTKASESMGTARIWSSLSWIQAKIARIELEHST